MPQMLQRQGGRQPDTPSADDGQAQGNFRRKLLIDIFKRSLDVASHAPSQT